MQWRFVTLVCSCVFLVSWWVSCEPKYSMNEAISDLLEVREIVFPSLHDPHKCMELCIIGGIIEGCTM